MLSEMRGSVRLVDALGLYYILLIRDSENRVIPLYYYLACGGTNKSV